MKPAMTALLLLLSISVWGKDGIITKPEPLNILWIIADDYSQDAGCYGNQDVFTPHIDMLAAQGKLFNHAFATSPVCSPSRSAFYTGMYQTSIGAHQHRTENMKPLPDSVEVITEYFKRKGYFTSNGDGTPESKPGKTDFNFLHEKNIFDGSDWSQRAKRQAFFASVQIHFPHRPFDRDLTHPVDPEKVHIPPYYPEHPVTRKDWAQYLESVQLLDKEVGKVLKRLENEGLSENTVVFFFSDQGRPMVRGKQWLYDGGIQVPLIIRWPGKIRKKTVSDDLVSLIDVSAASLSVADIDLPEHLQGQDFLKPPVKREYVYAGRNRMDAVVDHVRAVRNQQFKYIKNFMPERPYTQFGHYKEFYYPVLSLMKVLHQQGKLTIAQSRFMASQKPEEELYDLVEDPYELNNLYQEPAYESVLLKMRAQLNTWISATKDVGNDDPDDLEELKKRRWKKYGKRWEERGIDPRHDDPEKYLKWWEKELGITEEKSNDEKKYSLQTPFKPWSYTDELVKPIDSTYTTEYMNTRPPRIVADLKSDWTFNYFPASQPKEDIANPAFDDSQWPVIAVPHTWQTYETTGDLHPYIKNASERDDPYWWKGWGYYRKKFEVSDTLRDKQFFLEFDGVQKYTKVYVNGVLVGDHKGGFNSFSLDVTPQIKWGTDNLLVVMVNNFRRDKYNIAPMTAGNWNVYGGIYRSARLVVKNKVHIPYQGSYRHEGGIFITTPEVSREKATARLTTYVRNGSEMSQKVILTTTIKDPKGKTISTLKDEQSVAPYTTVQFDQLTGDIPNPELWHPASPALYKASSQVSVNGKLQDTFESPLGFRFFAWDFENDDLYVNGEKINIKGINRHQEYPWLGDAIPDWIQIKDMYDIKFGLGHNFMRAAHYPNDPLIYDLADQLGIIMVEEVPNIKSIDFNEVIQEQNVREMIRRDRNHPSIFFWSMGNETSDGADSKWAVEEDTTRLIHARKSEEVGEFVDHDHTNLDMENLLRVTIHGWFTQDDAPDSVNATPDNGQHASSEAWQHQMAMKKGGSVRGILNDNTMAWLYEDHGADREYKNSPVLHINAKGWVDNYRIPKYIYYLTRANYTEEPVLFVHPHYWRKQYIGQTKDIMIDSNFDEVEVLVNGKSKGVFYPGKTDFNALAIKNIRIAPGTFTARGHKDGNTVEAVLHMPGEPKKIVLTSTHQQVTADRSGLACLTAYILDDAGQVVFDAKNDLNWEVSGPATWVGYNAYSSDLDNIEAMEGTGYTSGPVSNVIRTTDKAGNITVTVSSPGLEKAEISLKSIKPAAGPIAILQPTLSNKSRLQVERIENFVEHTSFQEIIGRMTENQQFSGINRADYSQEMDRFIRSRSEEASNYSLGYSLLLDQLTQNLVRLKGTLIADDFNFAAEQFNNYAMLSNAIEANNLHVEYAKILKDHYASEVLRQNKQIDFEREVKLLQSIPKDHLPLYIMKPDQEHQTGEVEDNYVAKTFKVWSEDAVSGIKAAFPTYKNLSDEEQQLVFQYIARITPDIAYDSQKKAFLFDKVELLIIPTLDVQSLIDPLKADTLGQFIRN